MKDMFHNYDNHIDKKFDESPACYEKPRKILESDTVVKMVYNVKGDQIGVQAKYKDDFYLYFCMEGSVEGSSIYDLVTNSNIIFTVLDGAHQVVFSKEIEHSNYDCSTDTIRVYITPSEAAQLKQETYRVQLSLEWAGGGYELFAEKDAKLIIR